MAGPTSPMALAIRSVRGWITILTGATGTSFSGGGIIRARPIGGMNGPVNVTVGTPRSGVRIIIPAPWRATGATGVGVGRRFRAPPVRQWSGRNWPIRRPNTRPNPQNVLQGLLIPPPPRRNVPPMLPRNMRRFHLNVRQPRLNVWHPSRCSVPHPVTGQNQAARSKAEKVHRKRDLTAIAASKAGRPRRRGRPHQVAVAAVVAATGDVNNCRAGSSQ